MNIKRKEYERIIEITYSDLLQHIRSVVPSESFFLFIEYFCRVFGLDYTQIGIANNMFLSRLRPSKYERTVHAVYAGARLKDLGLDYRTIRSHRKLYAEGRFELYPRINNIFMLEEMRQFIIRYASLYIDNTTYIFDFIKEGGLAKELSTDDIYGGQ